MNSAAANERYDRKSKHTDLTAGTSSSSESSSLSLSSSSSDSELSGGVGGLTTFFLSFLDFFSS